jgi:hypothetical protein
MFQTRRSNFQSQLKPKAKKKKIKLEIVAPFEGFGRF